MFSVEAKVTKEEAEVDDFFKELEPTYVAPKTVEASKPVASVAARFEMDDDCVGDWEGEQLSFD